MTSAPEPEPASAARVPGRMRRAAAAAAATLLLTAVFAAATVVGVALHLDTAAARRAAQGAANDLLGPLFEGRIVVGAIDALSLRGARISVAEAIDARGARVIHARGLSVRVEVIPLLVDALFGKGALSVRIPHVRVEDVEVVVETNGAGGLTVGDAFLLRPSSSPPSTTRRATAARTVVVDLSHIEIGRGRAHGALAPPRALDAEIQRLRGSVRVGPEGVAVDVDQTGLVERAFLPATTRGTANYHLRAGVDLQMWSSFAGQVADLGITARAVLKNGHLEAEASAPLATPAEIGSLVPGHPITEPVSAQVQIEGDLPTFDLTASVAAVPAGPAGGSVAFEGRLDAAGPVRLDAEARVRDVDLRLFGVHLAEPAPAQVPAPKRAGVVAPAAEARAPAAPLPAPKINADGQLHVEIGDALRLIAEARTAPTEALGQQVPAADVHLVLDRGELHGAAHLYETGAPIDAAFSVLPRGQGVRFAANADVPSLQAAPRLAGPVDGSARVHVEGTLRGQELDARVAGAFSGLRIGAQVTLDRARVDGRVFGPLDALAVDASVTGEDARAGDYAFEALKADATGPLAAPKLRATLTDGDNTVDASGRLTSASGALRDVDVKVRREGNEITGKVTSIAPTRDGLAVDGIDLAGDRVGALRGKLTVRDDDVTGALHGEGVDLGRVARMLGVPLQVRGLANVDVALEHDRKNGRSGRVLLELEDGEIALLSGLSAHLSATIDHDRVKADGLVRIIARAPDKAGAAGAQTGALRCDGTIASVRLEGGDGTLKGPLLRASTWTGLVGTAEVGSPQEWDLGCLAQLVPIGHLVSEVSGKLAARFRVSRAAGERFPSLTDLSLRTRELAIEGPRALGEDHPAWASRSIDGHFKGSIDGTTGRAAAALTLFDGGLLGDASGSVDLDLDALTGPPAGRWASLLRSPVAGTASVPRRALSSFTTLPSFVRDALPPLVGEVRLDAYASGTVARPGVAIRGLGWGLTYVDPDAPGSADLAFPVDVDALLTYDSADAKLSAHVTRGPREIASVEADARAAIDDLLAPRRPGPRRPAWTGGLEITLREVPLAEIPLLGDNGVGGKASGVIAVRDLNAEPTLSADVDLLDLVLANDVYFERGKVALAITPKDKESGRGELRVSELSLDTYSGGRLKANAYAGVRWRDRLVPTLDGERADLFVSTQRFPLAAFHPLVGRMLSKLEGYLDGDVQVELGRPGGGDGGSLRAQLQIAEGVVHIPELGQELHDVRAQINAENGIVRIENVSAAGSTGRAQGWTLLRLDGLALRDGAGSLSIARGEELPLTLEGVPLGTAWGGLTFIVEKKEGELALRIAVPTLHLALPATSGRDVQALEDNPEITVSLPLGPEKRKRPADALRYAMTFDLGDVSVEGSGLTLHLAGAEDAPLRVLLSDEVRTTGDLVLTRGGFEVVGKTFEIERGLVRLREQEPSNPYVNLTAHWDAPDGTRIFVDFVGELRPITNKKLRFRSNPPGSQQDILARLLFGPDFADGATTDPSASKGVGGAAASVGGELASAQFNTLLSGITPLRGLSTRFGATSDGGLKTSVVYQLDDRLRALASFQEGSTRADGSTAGTTGTTGTTGTAAGGTAGQRAGRTEITIDWRFHKNWSLRGTVGVEDNTTSSGVLDLLWQYRY